MANKLQIRRDTLTNWETENPVLADGELVFINEIDGGNYDAFKIGNGVNYFKNLPSLFPNGFANRGLEHLKSSRYRNFEADTTLPAITSVGLLRPLETPMLIIESSVDDLTVVISEVPFIKDLYDNPTNWCVYGYGDSFGVQDGSSKILSIERIGDYDVDVTTYHNCVRLTLNYAMQYPAVGNHACIWSFLAHGIHYNFAPAFPSALAPGWTSADGHNTANAVGASWICSDGTYKAIVNTTYYRTPPAGSTYPYPWSIVPKLYSTTDRMNGKWDIVDNPGNTDVGCFDKITLPEGIIHFGNVLGCYKIPGTDLMFSAVSLYESHPESSGVYPYGRAKEMALIVYDETLEYQRLIVPSHDYVFENGISGNAYGMGACFYKGKYYLCIQDGGGVLYNEGAYGTAGKRVVLVSDNIEGEYTLHSTLFDLNTVKYDFPTSLFTFAAVNGQMVVFNNELYYLLACDSNELLSGSYSNFEFVLFKYDDNSKTWNIANASLFSAFHAAAQNYPELGDLTWGWDHMGVVTVLYVEGNKLWLGFTTTGGNYTSTIGYLDLTKALQ